MLANTEQLTRIMMQISLITLGLSLLCAFFFFRKYFNPIESTVNTLAHHYPDNESIHQPFLYINQSVTALSNDNLHMRQALEADHLQLHDVCMGMLLHGHTDGHEAQIQSIGVSGYYYSVCIVYLRDPDMMSSKSFPSLDADVMQSGFSGHIFQANFSAQYLILVFCYDSASITDCMSETEAWFELQTAHFPAYKSQFFACCGSITERLSEVCWSYDEAKTLRRMLLSEPHGDIFWYSQNVSPSRLYFYNVDLEQRLMNNIRIGNSVEVERLLDKVYRDNYLTNTLSAEMGRELLSELQGTLFKLSGNAAFHNLPEAESNEKIFLKLKDIFLSMAIKEHGCLVKPKTEEIGIRMKSYVEKHHTNSQLSLSILAEEFDLTESYVSKCFKTFTGNNFYAFLESCRVEHAAQLLVTGKYSINEISLLVGYTSDKSFRRAFKKLKGFAPSQNSSFDFEK